MNLWVKKTGLILGLALFLFACEEPGEIGLELGPDVGDFIGSFVEIPVNVGSIKSEPYFFSDYDTLFSLQEGDTITTIAYKRVSNLTVGANDSEIFGQSKISAFAQLLPLSFPVVIDTTATFEDVEIILNVTNYFGNSADINSAQYVDIYELSEKMDTVNFSNTEYSFNNAPIGTAEITVDPEESSTTVSAKLSDDFGMKIFNELLDSANESTKKRSVFLKFMNGLAFVPQDGNNLLFNINPLSTTRIDVNYKVDTLNKTTTLVMTGLMSQRVERNFSGTQFESIDFNTADYTTENFSINSTVGILGEFDFEPFFELADSIGPMALNKVTLIIDDIPVNQYYRNPSSVNLFYSQTNLFDIRELPFYGDNSSNINSTFIGGMLSRTDTVENTVNYSLGLTQAFSSLLQGNANSYKLLFAPSGYGSVPGQLYFDKDKVKMRIYFSHLKEEL